MAKSRTVLLIVVVLIVIAIVAWYVVTQTDYAMSIQLMRLNAGLG